MAVVIRTLTAKIMLHGCTSLKQKRGALGGLRDRFGKRTGLAVCESDCHDNLQQAEWTFVAAAGSAEVVQQMLAEVETYLATEIDGELLAAQGEWVR